MSAPLEKSLSREQLMVMTHEEIAEFFDVDDCEFVKPVEAFDEESWVEVFISGDES